MASDDVRGAAIHRTLIDQATTRQSDSAKRPPAASMLWNAPMLAWRVLTRTKLPVCNNWIKGRVLPLYLHSCVLSWTARKLQELQYNIKVYFSKLTVCSLVYVKTCLQHVTDTAEEHLGTTSHIPVRDGHCYVTARIENTLNYRL